MFDMASVTDQEVNVKIKILSKAKKKVINKFCTKCDYKTYHKDHFRQHVKAKHGDTIEIDTEKCTICDFQTQNRHELKKHKENTGHINTFFCDKCDYKSFRPRRLAAHFEETHDEGKGSFREKQYSCNECDFKTKIKGDLRSHLLTKHNIIENGSSIFQCYQCDYVSTRQSRLKIHMSAKHSTFKDFTCDECDFATATNDALRRHIISIHTHTRLQTDHENKSFPCDICASKFTILNYLKKHKKTVHGDKLFNCSFCDFSTSFQRSMKRHELAKHTGDIRNFPCDECDYKAKMPDLLKQVLVSSEAAMNRAL